MVLININEVCVATFPVCLTRSIMLGWIFRKNLLENCDMWLVTLICDLWLLNCDRWNVTDENCKHCCCWNVTCDWIANLTETEDSRPDERKQNSVKVSSAALASALASVALASSSSAVSVALASEASSLSSAASSEAAASSPLPLSAPASWAQLNYQWFKSGVEFS